MSSPVDIILNPRQLCDLEMILNGGFAPLYGFMNSNDYNSVLDNMHLSTGELFPLPITLAISSEIALDLIHRKATSINLKDQGLFLLATLKIEDIYLPDLEKECLKAYGTVDENHPYVKIAMQNKNMHYIGGHIIEKIMMPRHYDFVDDRLTANQTKQIIKENNWKTIVGFQTRNPMHRCHYELTKYALQQTGDPDAALLLSPTVGITQDCDIDYHVRVKCYKKILKYYQNPVKLCLLPLSMRMAGPREAILHAIIRQNYGCTHFVIGRDHAGPSSKTVNNQPFYGPYDAHKLAVQYQNELKIKIIFSEAFTYVKELDTYLQENEVPKGLTSLNISGTEQRDMLKKNIQIPTWFTYPEIYDELKNSSKAGVCLYFIGLSGAGKTTISTAIREKIAEIVPNRAISQLDGDLVRLNLSKGLGFSKSDRSTNVRRIGFVATEIVKHGGIVLCSNIAPYDVDRLYNRSTISEYGGYYEIYVKTDIDECERRDVKGLYKLAREGKLKQFTGIDDPFEEPTNPTIIINGNDEVDKNIKIILDQLSIDGYLTI
jgi:sulfate adenylyltransferase